MRESINRGCAWSMVVVSIVMLWVAAASFIIGKASSSKLLGVAVWALIMFFGVYVLFLKKPKDKAPK